MLPIEIVTQVTAEYGSVIIEELNMVETYER